MTKSTETGVAEERESFLTYDRRAFMADGKILVLGFFGGWKLCRTHALIEANLPNLLLGLQLVHDDLGHRATQPPSYWKLLGFRSDLAMS